MSINLVSILFNREENPLTERSKRFSAWQRKVNNHPQIANNLFLSKRTVRNYLSTAIQKMGVVFAVPRDSKGAGKRLEFNEGGVMVIVRFFHQQLVLFYCWGSHFLGQSHWIFVVEVCFFNLIKLS